ncbi:MAG: nucleotide exchange factor GrpE [Planctomycetes bacterium]|nr:nucleotide exchange factor GrpE [Planctomycetota bacterium]
MEALLGALRQWMIETDGLARSVPEGAGAAGEDEPGFVDVHSLVSELTALRAEVRLEARGTKTARERLEQTASAFEAGLDRTAEGVLDAAARLETGVGGALERLGLENDRLRSDLEQAREDLAARVLDALFDVLDSLQRGLEASLEARRKVRWRAWLLPRSLFGGLVDGYEMALRRLRRALADFEVAEIPCLGGAFDPERMRAVETREAAGAAPGQVLAVVRTGFERRGKVLRPAEVCTAAAEDVGAGDAHPGNHVEEREP